MPWRVTSVHRTNFFPAHQEVSTKLNMKSALLVATLISFSFALAANAQTATPADPTTHAEVKADAKSAEKAGTIPRGEASSNSDRDTTPSTANRKVVKANTKVAEKSGQLSRGEASKSMDKQSGAPSTESRAEVKAEAKQAEKTHQIPRGESQVNN